MRISDRAVSGADVRGVGGDGRRLAGVGRLTDVLSGPLGALVSKDLRVRPRQGRSIESVERLLCAVAEMTTHRHIRSVSVEMIAKQAGVTPQAAYRYFKDVEDVIGTTHRCIVAREYLSLVDGLAGSTFVGEAEFAKAVVDAIFRTCGTVWGMPSHVREGLLWQYRQLGFDASMAISGLLCSGAEPQDVRRSVDEAKLAACLTAAIAVATSVVSRSISPLRDGEPDVMLTRLFVGLLRSRDGTADGFCESGPDFIGLQMPLRAEALLN